MTRVLVAGLAPLPFENTPKSYGPGIRSWQFARSLAAGGHEVTLVATRIADAYDGDEGPSREERDGVHIERCDASLLVSSSPPLRRRLERGWAEAAVGATIYGSYALAQCRPAVPFWADQFGHVMAEAQAKAAVDASNRVLSYFWRLLEPVLRSADKFSVVSGPQRWAAIGELGATGRLTAETCGYEFVEVVPCAFVPERSLGSLARGETRVRLGIPEESFVVVWSGTYNVWSDVRTLVAGLELAMGRHPAVHFVSTGGGVPGHDERTYEELRRLVARSPHRDRFHLRGWVASEEVESHWACADLGVLAEKPIYEGALGSKNRIVQWMGFGLPVLSNRAGELGELLHDRRLALSFECGDVAALAERIAWATEHRSDLLALTREAKLYVSEHWSFAASTQPLRAWVDRPAPAPDRVVARRARSPADHSGVGPGLGRVTARLPWLRRPPWLLALARRLARIRSRA